MNTKNWDWLDWAAFVSLIVSALLLVGWLVWVVLESNVVPLFYSEPVEIVKDSLNVSCLPEYEHYNELTDVYYCNIDGIKTIG
jgi:hypothetical protein